MTRTEPLKICLVTAEFAPLAKTGGLADVCAALAAFLHGRGHDLRVVLPKYASIDTSGLDITPLGELQNVPLTLGSRESLWSIDVARLPGSRLEIHLLRCPELYDRASIYTTEADEHRRFVLLSRAAIALCQRTRFAPDIFHCHDWHTGLVPLYLKTIFADDPLLAKARSVLTIHNLAYQGVFPADVLDELGLDGAADELDPDDIANGCINFLKTGLLHADRLTTVSPTYAEEIQSSEHGMGLDHILRRRRDALAGILNGVDYGEWNPETDRLIACRYSAADPAGKAACKHHLAGEMRLEVPSDWPVIGMVTRLVSQKGIDLVREVVPAMLREREFALAVLGSGEPQYEQFFRELRESFPGRVAFRSGYDNGLAHRIEAGSDMFLMPSLYEPCGLNQMYSLRYGTVPIVRRTGGLADSVRHYEPRSGQGDGIVFDAYDTGGLRRALETALDLFTDSTAWLDIMQNGMRKDFSRDRQGERYVQLFRELAAAPT